MPEITTNNCTIGGWYWYCDEHDTHGNADSEDEAEFISEAHIKFHEEISFEAYKDDVVNHPDEEFDPDYEVETCEIEIYCIEKEI